MQNLFIFQLFAMSEMSVFTDENEIENKYLREPRICYDYNNPKAMKYRHSLWTERGTSFIDYIT